MYDPDAAAIVAELSVKYPLFATATIERWVDRETSRYRDASITTFVPILVRRQVEQTLHDLDTLDADAPAVLDRAR